MNKKTKTYLLNMKNFSNRFFFRTKFYVLFYEKRYLACKDIIKAYLDGADNSQLQEIADSFI